MFFKGSNDQINKKDIHIPEVIIAKPLTGTISCVFYLVEKSTDSPKNISIIRELPNIQLVTAFRSLLLLIEKSVESLPRL